MLAWGAISVPIIMPFPKKEGWHELIYLAEHHFFSVRKNSLPDYRKPLIGSKQSEEGLKSTNDPERMGKVSHTKKESRKEYRIPRSEDCEPSSGENVVTNKRRQICVADSFEGVLL